MTQFYHADEQMYGLNSPQKTSATGPNAPPRSRQPDHLRGPAWCWLRFGPTSRLSGRCAWRPACPRRISPRRVSA